MSNFYIYQGSLSSSEEITSSITSSQLTNSTGLYLDEVALFTYEGYNVGYSRRYSRHGLEDEIAPYFACLAESTTTTSAGSFSVDFVTEDSLDFIGPHTQSYSENLARLSKAASSFLLPSQPQALRLLSVGGIASTVATYEHPNRPDEFYMKVPKTSSKVGGRFKRMVNKILRRK